MPPAGAAQLSSRRRLPRAQVRGPVTGRGRCQRHVCPTVAPEGWDVSPGRAWGGAPSAGRAGRGRGRASPTQARGSARHVPLRLPFQCSSARWVTAGRPDGLPRGSPGGFITSPCCWGSIDVRFRIQSTRAISAFRGSADTHARTGGSSHV